MEYAYGTNITTQPDLRLNLTILNRTQTETAASVFVY